MKQSKLKTAAPRMKGSEHEVWTSPNGTFYKFDVSFENGDYGTALAKTNTGKYDIGAEYTYEIQQNGPSLFTIKGMKKVEQQGSNDGGGYSKKDDPAESRAIARQTAYAAATAYMSNVDVTSIKDAAECDNMINLLAEKLFEYMVEGNPEKRIRSIRGTAIKQAVEQMSIQPLQINRAAILVDRAKYIEQWLLR